MEIKNILNSNMDNFFKSPEEVKEYLKSKLKENLPIFQRVFLRPITIPKFVLHLKIYIQVY